MLDLILAALIAPLWIPFCHKAGFWAYWKYRRLQFGPSYGDHFTTAEIERIERLERE